MYELAGIQTGHDVDRFVKRYALQFWLFRDVYTRFLVSEAPIAPLSNCDMVIGMDIIKDGEFVIKDRIFMFRLTI